MRFVSTRALVSPRPGRIQHARRLHALCNCASGTGLVTRMPCRKGFPFTWQPCRCGQTGPLAKLKALSRDIVTNRGRKNSIHWARKTYNKSCGGSTLASPATHAHRSKHSQTGRMSQVRVHSARIVSLPITAPAGPRHQVAESTEGTANGMNTRYRPNFCQILELLKK